MVRTQRTISFKADFIAVFKSMCRQIWILFSEIKWGIQIFSTGMHSLTIYLVTQLTGRCNDIVKTENCSRFLTAFDISDFFHPSFHLHPILTGLACVTDLLVLLCAFGVIRHFKFYSFRFSTLITRVEIIYSPTPWSIYSKIWKYQISVVKNCDELFTTSKFLYLFDLFATSWHDVKLHPHFHCHW